ncbi:MULTISPECIES: aspartate kinase [Leptospira]|uniref:Aspartokinase n=6 Tax=Leptospira borgpetersenii TaxID=174 RepID=M3GSK1_LEPBO|nr:MULTISPECIES: aspartate kinase [Leptospira]EMF97818.1 aspartate kinase, monofunctional class [Leptospira borgpetersenii str. 200701203]EMO11659.1 aspartate kinase, monofunctional class [Leptospira borgpetersenii str. Noumea 25]EMO63251.1 aspartate kinase, monofunctional class [Leptospira borgpetersenii serovar Pomona str. 200901868]AXX14680.1 aspartate kinase [Leptospira borgpetersenii serovar Ceylonica]EKP14253.1 aspartate kinase, monofunctional class [Leptospira borgpetersenii str. 200801
MPNIIVQKYGGTSVGTPERIQNVARRIKSYHDKGQQIAVVVSAMGHTTDDLVELAAKISANPPKREMDMLLSTGEQISTALLAMALWEIGVPATSFTGSQIKLLTDGNFSNAKIKMIDRSRIDTALNEGKVAIIAGFQGIDEEENITTLGRGGSDTSAVAVAAVLGAKECEIYTDVDGVYTADPRIVPNAKKHTQITYEEMLELASLGAGVLHSRSVELGMNYDVVIHVRSSFNENQGTLVMSEDKIMEKLKVSGVTAKSDQARITIAEVPDKPGLAARLFGELNSKHILVDMIVQSSPHNGINTISFTISKKDVLQAKPILQGFSKTHNAKEPEINESIAIVSAVGVGMKSHVGVAAGMFQALADNGINIEMISTSEIKISCVIPEDQAKIAINKIHDVFGLSG